MTHRLERGWIRDRHVIHVRNPSLRQMVTSNPRARPDLLPVGRFGAVQEVSQVAVLLASNGYITGQTYNVNGGWYMS